MVIFYGYVNLPEGTNYDYNLKYIELHPLGMDQTTLHILFIFAWVVGKHLQKSRGFLGWKKKERSLWQAEFSVKLGYKLKQFQ